MEDKDWMDFEDDWVADFEDNWNPEAKFEGQEFVESSFDWSGIISWSNLEEELCNVIRVWYWIYLILGAFQVIVLVQLWLFDLIL